MTGDGHRRRHRRRRCRARCCCWTALLGLRGWQWLFLVEGLPAVLLAPIVLVWRTIIAGTGRLAARATNAGWLSATLAADHAAAPRAHVALREAIGNPRLWALAALYFCIVMAFYGVSFWLPQILQAGRGAERRPQTVLSGDPYASPPAAMVVVGRHSDRTGERRWHVAVPALVGAAGFVLTIAVSSAASVLALTGALSLAAMGIWGALGPFWALPPAFLRRPAAAGGVALVNSVGNLGGFAGPTLVGYVRDATGVIRRRPRGCWRRRWSPGRGSPCRCARRGPAEAGHYA